MSRKNRTPKENERRAKIRELLQMGGISSMDDIQNLFKVNYLPDLKTYDLTRGAMCFMVKVKNTLRTAEIMKIAICDDVPEFANELKGKVEEICAKNDWPLEYAIFTSPRIMLAEDLSSYQVVFLDIDMPEINGLEAAKELRTRYPDVILVFVTAFIEYAPAGYHVEAFRYLLKQQIEGDLPHVMSDINHRLRESTDTISVELKSGSTLIPLKKIMYLEGTPNRMVLFHVDYDSSPIEAIGKLTDYEQRLDGKGFLRLQKSFIANMSQISKISSYQVTLRNGVTLKASEKYYKQVHASFLQWKGQYL